MMYDFGVRLDDSDFKKDEPLQRQITEAVSILSSIENNGGYAEALARLRDERKRFLQEKIESFFQQRFPRLCGDIQRELHAILEAQLELDAMDEKVFKMQDLIGKVLGLVTECERLFASKGLPF